MKCKSCNLNITDDDLKCDGVCDRRFHAGCIKLNPDQVLFIQNTPGVSWCCCDCANPVCRILLSRLEVISKAVPASGSKTSATKRRSMSFSGSNDKIPPKPITPLQRLTRYQAKSKMTQPAKNATLPAKVNKPEVRLSVAPPDTEPKPSVPSAPKTSVPNTTPCDVSDNTAPDTILPKDSPAAPTPADRGPSSADNTSTVVDNSELTAAPPAQWLYISRCNTTTTADNVRSYVAKRLGLADSSSISCRQLQKKDADISSLEFVSFKLRVPPCHLDAAKCLSFWPVGIVVKNFTARSNFRRASLTETQL